MPSLISVIEEGIDICSNELIAVKAPFSILVTEEGIMICFNEHL